MKIIKRTFAAVLLFAILMLSGCDTKSDGKVETTTDGENATTSEPVIEQPRDLVVIADGKTDFTIIRDDLAQQPIINSVVNLYKRIMSFTDLRIPIKDDWVKQQTAPIDNDDHEILVGKTNRKASIDFIESLPENSYGYRVTDNKIIIAGTSETLTAYALFKFDSDLIVPNKTVSEGRFVVPVGAEFIDTKEQVESMPGIMSSSHTVTAVLGEMKSILPQKGYGVAQGACTDGTYFYTILKKKANNVETDIIVKTRIDGFGQVMVSDELPLDHANDMCYDTTRNALVITNMLGKTLSFVDPDTLTLREQITADALGGTPYAIAFNSNKNNFVILAGGCVNVTDTDFKIISSTPMVSAPYTGQGMDADDDFIYIPMSPKSETGTKDNVIMLYRWDGSFVRQIHVGTEKESETMMNFGGVHYMVFNNNGAKYATIDFAIEYGK